jgi:hypothetical protein
MSNGESNGPQSGDAGQPADQGEQVAANPPTPEELDQLDQSMTTERKPMGPEDQQQTEVAQNEPPADVPPTEPA